MTSEKHLAVRVGEVFNRDKGAQTAYTSTEGKKLELSFIKSTSDMNTFS